MVVPGTVPSPCGRMAEMEAKMTMEGIAESEEAKLTAAHLSGSA
jgi:hypothetical protein